MVVENEPASREELRQHWRINWLKSIAEFADYDLQCKSWFGGGEYSSPYYSFGEWMCRYFDDYALSDGYAPFIRDGFVTEAEVAVVSAFHAAAESYKAPKGDDYNYKAILADPNWRNVVELAEVARINLLRILESPSERAVLQQA